MKHIYTLIILTFLFIDLSAQARMANGRLAVGSLTNATETIEVFGDAQITGQNPFVRFKLTDSTPDAGDESGLHWRNSAGDPNMRMLYSWLDNRLYVLPDTDQSQAHFTVENSTGHVGVNVTNPLEQFHVVGNMLITDNIRLDGPEYVQFEESGFRKAYLSFDGDHLNLENDEVSGNINIDGENEIRLFTSDVEHMTITNAGNVGISNFFPSEKLDVNGAIRIGDAAGTSAGTIRYTGSDFEGRVGTSWVSMTAGGGGASVWTPSGANAYFNAGNVGIGTTSPAHKLQVNGDIGMTGEIIGVSDVRTKKEISAIDNASAIINKLRPVHYEFANEKFESLDLPQGKQFGFVAQEVENILPELVSISAVTEINGETTSLKGINYMQMIPVLTQAMQEQDLVIKKQQAQIDEQQAQIDTLNLMMETLIKK